jgi:transcriptional regulator with XRE-family HTH domain
MDYERVARETLRALRGRRSQAQLSRQLGYKSNAIFDWETGRRSPWASNLLRVAQRSRVDVRAAVARFARLSGGWPRSVDPASREGVSRLLNELKGTASITDIARDTSLSRFSISRWLAGSAEPRLPEFLVFVDRVSMRLLDFLAMLVDPEQLPSVKRDWQKHSLARSLAYDAPWSHVVLRALELEEYRKLPKHVPGFIARKVGISRDEEERSLELLRRADQVTREDGKFVIRETRTIDTRHDLVRSRKLRAFWARAGADRVERGDDGEFAFNLFGVSTKDLERLRTLQRDYVRELRAIVAQSEPVQHVVLTNLQLIPLSTPEETPATAAKKAPRKAR